MSNAACGRWQLLLTTNDAVHDFLVDHVVGIDGVDRPRLEDERFRLQPQGKALPLCCSATPAPAAVSRAREALEVVTGQNGFYWWETAQGKGSPARASPVKCCRDKDKPPCLGWAHLRFPG